MGASNNTKVIPRVASRKHWKMSSNARRCWASPGNTEVTPNVFNNVKNALEDIKNFVFLVFYLRDIGRHWGMLGNTKKMPKTLEQQGCQAMLTKYWEMWRIINNNIIIFDNDDGTLWKHWQMLSNTVKCWGTLSNIEKTLKNINIAEKTRKNAN